MDYQQGEPDKWDEVVTYTDNDNLTGRLVVDKDAVMYVAGTHLVFKEDSKLTASHTS